MVQDHPKFDAPPVIETVLAVQFSPLPGYSSAHAGWFWKEYLQKLGEGPSLQWSQAVDVPPLDDQLERFGAEDALLGPSVKFFQGMRTPRVQFIRSDGERMIQVQNSRFILNWKKQASVYPSYEVLLPEFRSVLHAFESFTAEARFGQPAYNQWELVYVDQIRKGDMWDSARDWSRIFPGLATPPVSIIQVPRTGDERISADWRFSLAKQRGRLYISLRQAWIQPSAEEVLNLTFTARGPVTDSETWEQGLEVGHEAVRETFLAITSREAQEHWMRRG